MAETPVSAPIDSKSSNQDGEQAVAFGDMIAGRVITSLVGIRSATEGAVLKIGNLLHRMVETATQDNQDVQATIESVMGSGNTSSQESSDSITDVIRHQSNSVSDFVNETNDFFAQQKEFVNSASNACDEIDSCATSVSNLMSKSSLLALNMQIESVRLGAEGRSFCVIAEEMKSFAAEVRSANENIKLALESLTEAVPKIKQQTVDMSGRVEEFSDLHKTQLQAVESKTQSLAESLEKTLEKAKSTNSMILACSQDTLSQLQFQDPMAQTLQRVEFDITKLQKLISSVHCSDVSLADIDPTVGRDGSVERETGEVDLF